MKKILLALSLMTGCAFVSNAQISNGGLPLSMVSLEANNAIQPAKTVYYQAPELQKVLLEDEKASRANPKPYRAGILINTDFSYPQSGTFITLANGSKIWRGQLNIANAPALVLYYDQFKLPHGVKLFITNANGKQILGAFTENNNAQNGHFANQEVQGNIVNLELNIDKDADAGNIKLHVNKAAYMYRSVEYLKQYSGSDDNSTAMKPTTDPFEGSSSVCEINAICPAGQNYPEQRKATMRILMPLDTSSVGLCTGTLINNTQGDCTPYVLTATHCEKNNSKMDTTYEDWLFYFNLETPDCAGTGTAPNTQTLRGATFVARADYNHNSEIILGDFLLLKLEDKIPASYGAYFAGWNRTAAMPANSTYTNFHHPAGDIKKLAVTNYITPNGTFNQWTINDTHWQVLNFNTGGNEGGSSGSALFDVNGRVIGDLSGGSNAQSCAAGTNAFGDTAVIFGKDAVYSKISRNWEYPEGNGAQNAQLKPWLDPTNTGAVTTNSLSAAATCNAPTTGITNRNAAFDNAISIFPNPVTNGTVRLRVNFDKPADLSVVIYDINGSRKATYQLANTRTGTYAFDMSGYANGTYLISVSNGEASTSKKVMLTR